MRKLLLSVLCVLCCASAFAQSEFYVGLKGGIAGNWMPHTTIMPDDKVLPNFGFYGGATFTYDITEFISAQTELLYSRKGVTTRGQVNGNKYVRNIHYALMPIYFSMRLSDDRCRVMIGPQFGYAIGDKIKSESFIEPAAASELNRFNLALAIQATYFVTDELGVDVKVEQAFTKTFKDSTDKGRNACVMFGICYRFGW